MKKIPFEVPNIGEKIRKLREGKSLTQEEMANLLGITQTAYGKIERGESSVSWKRLNQISEIFEKKLSEWIEVEEKAHYSNNQCQIKGNGFVIQPESISENERKLYEEQIVLLKEQNIHLKEEVIYLRKLSKIG
jgi:transcriptional regulator with XRE-family HTH domain